MGLRRCPEPPRGPEEARTPGTPLRASRGGKRPGRRGVRRGTWAGGLRPDPAPGRASATAAEGRWGRVPASRGIPGDGHPPLLRAPSSGCPARTGTGCFLGAGRGFPCCSRASASGALAVPLRAESGPGASGTPLGRGRCRWVRLSTPSCRSLSSFLMLLTLGHFSSPRGNWRLLLVLILAAGAGDMWHLAAGVTGGMAFVKFTRPTVGLRDVWAGASADYS